MLRFILADLTLFAPGDDVEQAQRDLNWWLEALTQRDQDYLLQHPETPRLYKSGVRYEVPKQFAGECEEVRVLRQALGRAARRGDVARVLDLVQQVLGGERFRDIGRILENGGGDCDNVSCWRAAELRQAGIKAQSCMTHRKRADGGTTYHALVRWPPHDGVPYDTSEDPSLLLGMGGPDRAADRAIEIQKNQERCEIFRARGADDVFFPVATPSLTAVDRDLAGALGLVPARRALASSDLLAEIDGDLRRRRAA